MLVNSVPLSLSLPLGLHRRGKRLDPLGRPEIFREHADRPGAGSAGVRGRRVFDIFLIKRISSRPMP